MKMPALFIGHGSPTNVVEDNSFTKHLKYLGKILPKPKAIMVISAHWMTKGIFVSSTKEPKMIYDFYGFPDELYQIKYSCPGAREIARQLEKKFPDKIKAEAEYGLDHGSWTVLKHIYPDADIPVFEMSVDIYQPLKSHFDFGKQISFLRDEDILIIGSGNIIHNLRDINWEGRDAEIFEWAVKADDEIKKLLISGDYKTLMDPHTISPEVKHSIPSFDHYIPMINILGMKLNNETLQFTHESIQYGSISMRSFMIS